MRHSLLIVIVLVAACAARAPAPPRTPERHAANIAAAQAAGYKVVSRGDHTVFCPTAPPTGTHMAATCLSEGEWEAALGVARTASPAEHVTHQSPGPGPGAGH